MPIYFPMILKAQVELKLNASLSCNLSKRDSRRGSVTIGKAQSLSGNPLRRIQSFTQRESVLRDRQERPERWSIARNSRRKPVM